MAPPASNDEHGEEGLFRTLEKRPPLKEPKVHRAPTVRPPPPPSPPLWMVVTASLRWGLMIFRFMLWYQPRRLLGRVTTQQFAVALRKALERMGATGPRVGKQLAMRIDLMPLEVSLQLAAMRDPKPPMSFEVAMGRLREAAEKPLEEVYEAIDPDPILSNTVECVYQGYLKSGERVAIRIRRDGIRARILADIRALSMFTRINELMGLVRPGFFDQLRAELVDLAHEELDFSLQARQQTLFRKRARRDDLSWLSAPDIHRKLCSDSVMVSEWASGVRLSEILDALEQKNEDFMLRLVELDIQPERVARRLLQASWWGLLENLFFVAQPNAEEIVVRPGNKLVFLGFHDCGTMPTNQKRLYRQILERLGEDDASGASQAIVQLFSPLPFIDVFDFGKRIESGLWYELFALKDSQSAWWERTTIGLWRRVLSCCRHDGVTPRLEVLRMMRSTLAFDTMAARLKPDVKLLREFDRYRMASDRRAARRYAEDLDKTSLEDLESRWIARTARITEGMMRLGLWVEATVENLPVSNLALSGKASYAAAQVLRSGVAIFAIFLFVFVARATVFFAQDQPVPPIVHIRAILTNPLFGLAVIILLSLTLRRILFRLDDKGDD